MIRRVLITTEPGDRRWPEVVSLAKELALHGTEVAVAAMGAPISTDHCREIRAIAGLEVYESDLTPEWTRNPWSESRNVRRWLLALEDALLPDLVHLSGLCYAGLPWTAPRFVVCHSCPRQWRDEIRAAAAPEEWQRFEGDVRNGLHLAALVGASSQAHLDEANRLYGPFCRSTTLPHAPERQVRAYLAAYRLLASESSPDLPFAPLPSAARTHYAL